MATRTKKTVRLARYPTISLEPGIYDRILELRDRHGCNNQRFIGSMLEHFASLSIDKQAALIRGELNDKKK